MSPQIRHVLYSKSNLVGFLQVLFLIPFLVSLLLKTLLRSLYQVETHPKILHTNRPTVSINCTCKHKLTVVYTICMSGYCTAGLYASFLKGQGHQGIFCLVKGTLCGNCQFLQEHFEGTKAMIKGHGGNRLHCLWEPRIFKQFYNFQCRPTVWQFSRRNNLFTFRYVHVHVEAVL